MSWSVGQCTCQMYAALLSCSAAQPPKAALGRQHPTDATADCIMGEQEECFVTLAPRALVKGKKVIIPVHMASTQATCPGTFLLPPLALAEV